jgi:hypothetical protein
VNHHPRRLRLLGGALIAPIPALGIASAGHAQPVMEVSDPVGTLALQGEVLDVGDVLVTDRANQGCGGEVMLVDPTGGQTTVASNGSFCSP